MATALIIVDIQNDYFPGGKMELVNSLAAGECAGKLLKFFRETRLPAVHIQHVATRPGSTFFLPETEGVKIHSSVQPHTGETIIQKHFPNSFRNTQLADHLRDKKVQRLVICGMMTHMCLDATTRAATDLGFDCLIAQDACATRALKFGDKIIPADQVHAAFLAALHGSYGQVLPTAEILSLLS